MFIPIKFASHSVIAILILHVCSASALDTSSEEKTCQEIGFKEKTEAFGNCVLELYGRNNSAGTDNLAVTSQTRGDGSQDDQTCQRYGFKPGASDYSDCRMKIDLAKQEAAQAQARYQAELRAYQIALEEKKRQDDEARNLRQFELGMRMLGGQSIGSAARDVGTGNPITPPRPPTETQTIRLPSGSVINCTTTGTFTNCR